MTAPASPYSGGPASPRGFDLRALTPEGTPGAELFFVSAALAGRLLLALRPVAGETPLASPPPWPPAWLEEARAIELELDLAHKERGLPSPFPPPSAREEQAIREHREGVAIALRAPAAPGRVRTAKLATPMAILTRDELTAMAMAIGGGADVELRALGAFLGSLRHEARVER